MRSLKSLALCSALVLGGGTAIASASAADAHARSAAVSDNARTAALSGQLTLITEPQEGVAPILSAIGSAHHQVEMVMYEDNDSQVDAALVAAAKRGVKVRVLLNSGYYGEGFPQDVGAYNYLKAHGVPVRWTPKYFALTHQKTLVVDGRAYILTFNLTPQYYVSSRDFGVEDTNAADVSAIETTFTADWGGHKITAPTGSDLVWSPGSQPAQVQLINSATTSLDIYNEEMDSPAIESALEGAAKRGVDVRVTMTADSSWDSAFSELAAAGVHIHTYAASASLYIHAKMILTPTKVFLGSENFSTYSMDRNRELGLITSDAAIRASLSSTFNADYAGATPYAGGTSTGKSSGPAKCSIASSHSSKYNDWNVDVSSNQPDETATAVDTSGVTANYKTNSSGTADIYLKAPASAAGQKVTVHVGTATCASTL